MDLPWEAVVVTLENANLTLKDIMYLSVIYLVYHRLGDRMRLISRHVRIIAQEVNKYQTNFEELRNDEISKTGI